MIQSRQRGGVGNGGFLLVSDEQWSRIEPLLPTGSRGARRVDDRRVLSGIVHALQSGGRWGDCPPVYGPKKTLYNRFVRWAERGIWQDIFSALAGAEGPPGRLFIDSTCIKVHRTAGGAKGGLGQWYRPDTREAKLQGPCAVCDVNGRPCVLMVTPGNVHDVTVAKACIAAMPPSAELVGQEL